MRTQKSTISIDWLQVLCTKQQNTVETQAFVTSPQTNEHGMHNTYILVDAREFTIGYEYHKTVMLGKTAVAHLSWCPKRENVEQTNASIKLSNNLLYTNQWHFILGDICKAIGWQYKSITRIDIALDVNYFLHGLRPEIFIHKYLRGRQKSFIRCGSNKFSIVGEKYEKGTRIDYIRWGSRTSGVCTYLYNKSKEMHDKTMKPWIIEKWRSAGLDVKNVWRIEFSINSSGRGLKDIETGLIHTLFIDDIETQHQLKSIFQTYALRYFHFKQIVKDGAKYVKDMKDFQLIDLSQTSNLIPCQLYQNTKKSASIQNCIVMLEEMRDTLKSTTPQQHEQDTQSINTVEYLLMQRLSAQKISENAEEALQQEISKRLLQKTHQLTAQERLLRANSYMDNQSYREDICTRTAQRIVALLMSRKRSIKLA